MPDPVSQPLAPPVVNGNGSRADESLTHWVSAYAKTHEVDQPRIRAAVREILLAIGEDPDRDGLQDTPDRIARMYTEVFAGLRDDPARHLERSFEQHYDEIVVVKDIQFSSFCEHHLLPFTGFAHVGYIPKGRVVGLSKIPRVLETLARRPQLQERLTQDLAEMLMTHVDACGVGVVIEATHSCLTVRGANKPGSSMVTSAMLGLFRERIATRQEFLSLVLRDKP
jgi:GTP cyclohydrolase I